MYIDSAKATIGDFTLEGLLKKDGTITYALKSPDGSSFLGPGPLTVGTQPGTPTDSTGTPMVGYKYYTLGIDNYILLTDEQGAALIAALPQLLSDVNAQLAPPPPPPPAPPPTPTISTPANAGNTTAATNSTNTLSGEASDDSGSQQQNTATTQANVASGGTTTGTQDAANTTSVNTNAPANPAAERENEGIGEADDSTKGNPPYENEKFIRSSEDRINNRPGRRLKNPLGYLSSYTYQLSLYMISPDAYDAFVASGRRDINLYNEQFATTTAANEAAEQGRSGGAFLIAQSGGVGNSDRRAEGFDLDYYIDNLTFKHYASPKDTGGPLGNTEFRFQIIEPYGFSFITKLRDAQNKLIENAGGKGNINSAPTKQFFILGIRFFGYDQSGRPVKGSEIFDGNPLDPNSPGTGAIFETFYDIVITKVKFKIDGRATTYDIEAATVGPNLSVNIKKGFINSLKEVYGSTVRDMISGEKGLITLLNQEQQDLVKNKTISIPTVYKVEWLGDAEQIAISSVVSEIKQDKATQPGSNAKDTTQVNDATGTKDSPNKTKQKMSFDNRPIIQAIDQIIARSKYLEDAMEFNYSDAKQNNPKTAGPDIGKTSNKKLTWFNISPQISDIKWDKKIKDWAYTITYKIQTYLIPAIDNPYATKKTKYYGPHKRYRYWYTGENQEIIGYEQRLDNAFFNVVVAGDPAESASKKTSDDTTSGPSSTSTGVNMQSGGDKEGDRGTLSGAAVNSVRTNLYDPNALARAKVQILGDPDYLMQEVPAGTTGINQAYNRFYKDNGFTINPTGGQVFFEIDFKEAVDYSTSSVDITFEGDKGIKGQGGTMSINDSILFWKYPDEIRQMIDGIVYTLTTVTSSFRNGSFTQTLDAYVETFSEEKALSDEEQTALDEDLNRGNGPGQSIDDEAITSSPRPEQPVNSDDTVTAAVAPPMTEKNS